MTTALAVWGGGARAEDDYLAHCVFYSDGRVARFDHMPITVRVGTVPAGADGRGYLDAVRRAAELWTEATDGLARFEFVSDRAAPEAVDIPVRWVTSLPGYVQERHLARTTLIRPTRDEFRVRMDLGVVDRANGRLLTNEEMLTACLHELGHAIGLWGHSPIAADVMSPASAARAPTRRDVATLSRLYDLPLNTPLHDQALPLLEAQVRADPESATLHLLFGSLLFDSGDHDGAIREFLTALEWDDTISEAEEKLVLVYLEAGRTDEAIERMETTGGSSPEFYNNAGIAFADKGQPDRAIAAFEAALRIKADFAMARRNLGRIYGQRAQDFVDQGRFVDAEAPLRKAIEIFPEMESFGMLMGVVLSRIGREGEAVAQYEDVLARFPGKTEVHAFIANSLNNMGVAKIDLGDWQGALADFDRAVQHDPASEAAQENRGLVLWRWAESLETRDPGKAIGLFQAYAEQDPASSEAHVRVGVIYANHNDFPRAIDAFAQAQAIDPTAEHIRTNLRGMYLQHANQLQHAGQFDAAVDQVHKGLELDPDYVDLYRTLGVIEQDRGRFEEAAAAYTEILRRDPTDEWVRQALTNLVLTRGNDAYQRGDYSQAIAEFGRVPHDVRSTSVWTMLGFLYLETNQVPAAVDALGHGLFTDPSDKTARQNMDVCIDQLKEEVDEEDVSGPASAALVRANAYRLTAGILVDMGAETLRQFSQLLDHLPNDDATVAAVQECALHVARKAHATRPAEAKRIAQAALALGPHRPSLAEWLDGVGVATPGSQ